MNSTQGDASGTGSGAASLAWVDGAIIPLELARVPFLDRGFLFGEAVYEALYARNGRCFRRRLHEERLMRSGSGVGIETTRVLDRVKQGMEELLAAAPGEDGLLYIQLTGGIAPREHLPPEPAPGPEVYLFWSAIDVNHLEKLQSEGITVVTFPDDRWSRATYKTTQLLASVLSKKAAREAGAGEAIYLDARRNLLEGGSTNVFVVKDGRVATPPSAANLLPGITRRALLEGRPELVREEAIDLEALLEADECFVASTTRPVVAVREVDGTAIGEAVPGPVTLELQAFLRSEIDDELGRRPENLP
jgi:D-alanine transaminase